MKKIGGLSLVLTLGACGSGGGTVSPDDFAEMGATDQAALIADAVCSRRGRCGLYRYQCETPQKLDLSRTIEEYFEEFCAVRTADIDVDACESEVRASLLADLAVADAPLNDAQSGLAVECVNEARENECAETNFDALRDQLGPLEYYQASSTDGILLGYFDPPACEATFSQVGDLALN